MDISKKWVVCFYPVHPFPPGVVNPTTPGVASPTPPIPYSLQTRKNITKHINIIRCTIYIMLYVLYYIHQCTIHPCIAIPYNSHMSTYVTTPYIASHVNKVPKNTAFYHAINYIWCQYTACRCIFYTMQRAYVRVL